MNNDTISLSQLIEAIEQSVAHVETVVRDTDYYAKRDDVTFHYVEVIVPHKLLEELRRIKDSR